MIMTFLYFQRQMNKICIHLFSIADPDQFSGKFSRRYTDISITNCNTVYSTRCNSLLEALLVSELLLKGVKDTSIVLVRVHTISVLLV